MKVNELQRTRVQRYLKIKLYFCDIVTFFKRFGLHSIDTLTKIIIEWFFRRFLANVLIGIIIGALLAYIWLDRRLGS